MELSTEMVSKITDRILLEVREWQSPLPPESGLSVCIHGLHLLQSQPLGRMLLDLERELSIYR